MGVKEDLSNARIATFDFNSLQDVAEILQVVLDELKGTSLAASSLISNTQKTTVYCNICLCFSVSGKSLFQGKTKYQLTYKFCQPVSKPFDFIITE